MHSWKKSLRSTTLAALLAFSSTTVALAAPNVTLNVHDGEVRDVLTAISALSDASIVTDESVKGKITIALDNVPFNTAIKLITSAKGLAYRMVDGVILVSTQENLNKFNGSVNVFKLNYAKAEDVKNALNDILESEKKISIDPITNSILFSGSSTDEERVRSAIKAMDVATKQITLEAKIISINKEDSKNLGINWNWDKIPQNSEDSNNSSNNDDDEDFGGVVHFGASYEFRFNATLNALFANGKAKILATPRIITVPGKEASIFIGDHIPVLTEKIENGITVNTTEYVDAGIKLTYTPLVSEDDMITSAVHTEVSTPTLVSEIKNYKITSRTADTYVRMRNGETLIIGGLITGSVMITAGTVMRGMEVNSAIDMAVQLEPTLGSFSVPFLAMGLIAAGISSAVITPLGVSYVLAGLFGWEMNKKDKRFFWTNIAVVVAGIIVAATGFNPIWIIMTAQAVNGIFLPIIVFTLVYVTSRSRVMGQYKNNMVQNVLGAAVFLISLVIGINSLTSLF